MTPNFIHKAGFRLVFASAVIVTELFLGNGWTSLGGMIVIWFLAWGDQDADSE